MDNWERQRSSRARLSDRARTYLAALVALLVTVCVLMLDNGTSGLRFRSWLGMDDRVVAPVEPRGNGRYKFFETQHGSKEPVAWNPCEPIHYVVNPQGAPDGWEQIVEASVAVVSEAAGLSFEYDGLTEDRSFGDRIDGIGRAEPALIGWADEDEVDALADDVAGIGGPTVLRFGERLYFVSGSVVLDTRTTDDLETAPGGRAAHVALLLHELGHLVGLDHVDDEGELMYPEGLTRADYGPGDRAGLAALGAIPCR